MTDQNQNPPPPKAPETKVITLTSAQAAAINAHKTAGYVREGDPIGVVETPEGDVVTLIVGKKRVDVVLP